MDEVEDLTVPPAETSNHDALDNALRGKWPRFGHKMRKLFLFDEQYKNLNHGKAPSFHLL
jgi:hypothetical protein